MVLVGNACYFYNGNYTLCSQRVDREGALRVKFNVRFVPIEQDVPFEERKSSGTIKQHLPHVRNASTDEKLCAMQKRLGAERHAPPQHWVMHDYRVKPHTENNCRQ